MILGTVAADLFLDLGEGYDKHGEAAAPGGQVPGQLQYLLPGLLGGVGRRGKVQHFQLYATLGHHIAGHRGVDTAGQQGHGVAAHADGQTAGGGFGRAVNVGGILTDLHKHGQLGVVHVYLCIGEGFSQMAAHILAQLNGAEGEGLVGPLAFHFEAAGSTHGVAQVGLGRLQNGVLVLLAGQGTGHGDDAEDLLAGGHGGAHVAGGLGGLHIDGALLGVDLELAEAADPAADVAHEFHFKAAAVQALEDHLAQLAKDHFLHG